jgi:indoleamine 2,3-dioxygenase
MVILMEDHKFLTEFGFLGEPNDGTELRETNLRELEKLVEYLPVYIANGELRKKVESLTDAISITDLNSLIKCQIEAAFRIYAFILQAYVRGNSKDAVIDILPGNFSKQLTFLSETVGCEPIINYAATVSYNWHLLPDKVVDARKMFEGDMRMTTLFTGAIDEAWFYMISAAVDCYSLDIIKLALKKDDAMFVDLVIIINKITNTLKRMYDENMPEYFYTKIRRFMSGWLEDPELPEGVLYTFPNGDKKRLFLSGASAAQSPTIHLLDIILDISHPNDPFLGEMRKYMPREHRQILEYFEQQYKGKRSGFLSQTGFKDCVEAMKRFRQVHFDLVKNYILKFGGSHGTGGSNPSILLASLINDTKL